MNYDKFLLKCSQCWCAERKRDRDEASFFNFVQNDVKRMKDTRMTCEIYSFLKPKCFFQQIDEEVIDRSSKVTTNDTLARKIQKTLT